MLGSHTKCVVSIRLFPGRKLALETLIVYVTSMGQAKRKLRPEEIAEAVWLWRRGASFAELGRKYDVDPRTVARGVRTAEGALKEEHWEAVTRQVDADLLRQHYQGVVAAALSLQAIVHSHPLDVSPDWTAAKSFLAGRLTSSAGWPSAASAQPPSDEASPQRLSDALYQDLLQHEPEVARALGRWMDCWDDIQRLRSKTETTATNYLKQQRIGLDSVPGLSAELARESLDSVLRGKEPLSFGEGSREGQLVRGGRQLCLVAPAEVDAVKKAYEWALGELCKVLEADGAASSERDLRLSVHALDPLIDRLVLSGRPGRACSLFGLRKEPPAGVGQPPGPGRG